jgi:uncharacterized protein (DUF885 family)
MTAFAQFVADLHSHFTSDPNERIAKGIDRDLGEMPDPSLEAAEARRRRAERLSEAGRALDRSHLGADEALDLDLALLMLESQAHRLSLGFNDRSQLAQMPRAGDEIGDGIFLLMANDPRPSGDRLADITARLEQVPAYLEAMLARLEVPVGRWVDIEREKVGGMDGLFEAAVAMSAEHGWVDHPRLERAVGEATAGIERYLGRLGELETTASFHLEEGDARRLVALRGIEQSLEDLHQMARSFLADTTAELDELRGRLAPKYGLPADTTLAALHDHLNARFAVPTDGGAPSEAILARYGAERSRILEFIGERELFPIPADQEIRLVATPRFLEPSIPAGAMMPPPPFRDGTRTSLVYLTIKEDRLDDHTDLGIPSMMIHEGIPGHHLQLATASTHASVIRRHVDASEQAEGWTTMLEDYMLDLGYMGELTDEARFVGKRDLSRIGARVAIDLFFMTGRREFLEVGTGADVSSPDPFAAAAALLIAVTGFSSGRAEAELNWYSQERGYPLCYLTGNRLVWDMKRAAAAGPSGLTGLELDRRFHRAYLEAGNMPLSFLRRVLVADGLITEAAT